MNIQNYKIIALNKETGIEELKACRYREHKIFEQEKSFLYFWKRKKKYIHYTESLSSFKKSFYVIANSLWLSNKYQNVKIIEDYYFDNDFNIEEDSYRYIIIWENGFWHTASLHTSLN